jgi:chromosome segregation protein
VRLDSAEAEFHALKFTKLQIAGFKTFVEPTEFPIEPGLTAVIGPNGCGKSNLVEALRWVMGESSSKNMRASGMDDVIFSGGSNRPARNMAEVLLRLDNSDRSAPAAFNDHDVIEVSRRIERETGSHYRVNGREARARDVQLLFADASTGARSSSMVRQGQIGELIAAKPQDRRRILEEAAGVAGLHSRRHEAELRLKAAEENLTRLDDVLRQIESQEKGLERQARQASRYRTIAAEIRRSEALLALVHHAEATEALAAAGRKLDADKQEVVERTRLQGEAARLQAVASHELEGLHEAEVEATAELQKLVAAREMLDGEERRVKGRMAELERRLSQLRGDLARETAMVADAGDVLARLAAEAGTLRAETEGQADQELEARARSEAAEAALARSEAELAAVQEKRAAMVAARSSLDATIAEERKRIIRLEAELEKICAEQAKLDTSLADDADSASLVEAFAAAQERAAALEVEVGSAEARHQELRAAETQIRTPLAEAERKAQSLETQVQTLTKLLTAGTGKSWPPVTEEISVAKGYEAALGAALGDDLDASTDPSAPAHWVHTDASADAALPAGVEPLSGLVEAPLALTRRLDQIGVVAREEGPALRKLLKPGQRLVSKEGDLWRWDGFAQAAEAPTPAARRLTEKNRLGDLRSEAEAAREAAETARREAERSHAELTAAATAEQDTRQRSKAARREVESLREQSAAVQRRREAATARLEALAESYRRVATDLAEARAKHDDAGSALAELAAPGDMDSSLEAARAEAAGARTAAADARSALQACVRNAEVRAKRLAAIEAERKTWEVRSSGADSQIASFEARIAESDEEYRGLAEAPDTFSEARLGLRDRIEVAEAGCKSAADARAAAQTRVKETDKAARLALEAMAAAREEMARSEARLEAARGRAEELMHAITAEDGEGGNPILRLAEAAGLAPTDTLPEAGPIEARLEVLKADRERLGAVNLRADEELGEITTSKSKLTTEHEDLTEAIRRLRQAIASLNKEGRERLVGAFDTVNTHFKQLFTTLFGGGSAELQLVESEDPLEAGLEILARPPGKKPQVMTLLSGGEQALTAMSLIFAIFLTNPSPICVLDEVDAPLDDANVERFCDLLDEMRKKTETRFITITHNPITMARMNRLFGVTMAERGVSQLVSVDLEDVEHLLEAG